MYEYKARVTDVYDGDTITVDIDLGCKTWIRGERIRLVGINAPEMRGEERGRGIAAREALRSQVLGKDIVLRTEKDTKGKYGRYLGVVIRNGVVINDWMIENGFAEVYYP